MNRRHFISKSSLAILAATGLPKAAFNTQDDESTYRTKLEPGIAKQTSYELQINHACLKDFATATDEQKKITLKVAYYETADFTNPTKGAEFIFIVKESVAIDTAWKVKAKLDKKVSGDYKLPEAFAKNIILKGKEYDYFNIVDKKDVILAEMPYPRSTSDDDGCFLTTACVQHKQLADDCDELNTLRFLRDNYMQQDAEGIILANEYKIIGPKIVQSINRLDNKAEIYNYMYDHLVEPSVKLIKAERYAEATTYYKDFVTGLTKEYL